MINWWAAQRMRTSPCLGISGDGIIVFGDFIPVLFSCTFCILGAGIFLEDTTIRIFTSVTMALGFENHGVESLNVP
jgi:hypothetical protein